MTLTIRSTGSPPGEEGQAAPPEAIPMAISKSDEITDQIYSDPHPRRPTLKAADIPGSGLTYNPDRRRDCGPRPTPSPRGTAPSDRHHNSDGGHKEWVDGTAGSIKNTLNISAGQANRPQDHAQQD